MKDYKITVNQGFSAVVRADNKAELLKKLSTGHYGVVPVRGRMIPFTTENVKEIVELVEETK